MGNQQTRLTPEQLADIQRATHFDKKEITHWYRGFLKDCPSGQLDRQEFLRIYKQFFPFGDPSRFAEYVFQVFDQDRNGLVDFREFMVALSITTRGKLEERVQFAFQLYDLDRDGFVSRQEMLKIVDALYRMVGSMVRPPPEEETPEKRVNRIFQMMNKADGKLSKQEFLEASRKDPTILQALSVYDGLV